MGSEPNSTPKLSLYSLPNKPPEPPGLLTPPLHSVASIPFHWEEAPGKPRPTTTATATPPCKSKTPKCLDLPPRLLSESAKFTNAPSPTTVLDGPYAARSLHHTVSFSSPRGPCRGPEGGRRENKGEKLKFGSARWDSFKGISREGSFDFSSFPVRRRRSKFLSLSNTSSNLLANIYESFKQALPWRRRQENLRKIGPSHSLPSNSLVTSHSLP